MQVMVTGATGLVGHAVAAALVRRGDTVRALVRDPARARPLLPEGVEPVAGDLTAGAVALAGALEGAEILFHAAGVPESWQRDEAVFDRVNRLGTRHLLQAARAAGVRRVVHTSAMEVFAAPRGGTLVEGPLDAREKSTAYQRSMMAAQREVDEAATHALDVVSVNPAAVLGPAPVVTGLNAFLAKLLAGEVALLPPGGLSFVSAEGLARAQLAAADRGRAGERYLVSDGYASNAELAREVASAAGLPRLPHTAPEWLMVAAARSLTPLARTFGFRPPLSPGELAFVLWQAKVDASKARRELGFTPTPLGDSVRRTVDWLRARA